MSDFENRIRALTVPRDGAYPRPWMTDTNPTQADVLIVGASSAKTFLAADVGSHEQFLDALWNRNGASCRAIYQAATRTPSRARPNLDRLSRMLEEEGLTSLQTNVSCASAAYDRLLKDVDRVHGTELFKAVVFGVPWRAMIIHGIGASARFGESMGMKMPPVPSPDSSPVWFEVERRPVFISPSLAPPSYRISVWTYLERVVAEIATTLLASEDGIAINSETEGSCSSRTSAARVSPPVAFVHSAANMFIWERLHEIEQSTGLQIVRSTQQVSLTGGPALSSTTRVFRHKFKASRPDLLVREDVLDFSPGLRNATAWTTHKTPIFKSIRSDNLQLIGQVLQAVEDFAVARAD
ncbi:hypothetical protein ACHFJ0_00550 [Paracoccus sp. NGMCC 1.201697]|uniref:Uncharacterized protein n=1 Tax=Paracoccus broussonetiae subsp. drimophilus TaxID=3373869 RepID=A0ABW7LH39_9RHOB